MPRRSNNRRRARRTANYSLPDSTIIKSRAITRVDMVVGFSKTESDVQPHHLLGDIANSSNRMCLFDRFRLRLSPPTTATSTGALLNLSNIFTAQVFAVSVAGYDTPISKAIALSMVSPKTLSFRIPDWLTGPLDPQSTVNLFKVIWRCSNNVVTSDVVFGMEVEATGRLTNPVVTTF
jgi:hypothetical protein